MAIDSLNRIVISDREGHKIQVYDRELLEGPLLPISNSMNDAWYNPATAGQGLFVHVYEQSQIVFVTWFTYDVERPDYAGEANFGGVGQRWFTAQGSNSTYQAELTLNKTTDGLFLSEMASPETEPIGSMDIKFRECNRLEISISIPQANINETIDVHRLASDGIERCELRNADP